jgi:hypothetical protein
MIDHCIKGIPFSSSQPSLPPLKPADATWAMDLRMGKVCETDVYIYTHIDRV